MTLTAGIMARVEAAKRDEAREAARALQVGEEMERLARPRAVTLYRIANWQPRGTRVMLAAQFKAGKTTVVGNVLRSLVDGDDFLGRDPVTPVQGTVIDIDTEMSESQLDRWHGDQRIQHDDRVMVLPMRGHAAAFNILDAEIRAQWAARFNQCGASYLVLDCLRPILDALGLDEHRDTGRFLVAFDALLREAGIEEALVVHHMGHLGERARGDSRLRDWPDVEWRLIRQDDDPASPRFLTAYGRDVDVPESQLTYDRETRRLALAGGSRKDARTDLVLGAIIDILAGSPPLSGRQVKAALAESDHSREAIEDALRAGHRDGRLIVDDGPKRSRLYRVSGSVRPVSAGHSAGVVSECPAALRKADTPDTPRRLPLGRVVSSVRPDTQLKDDDAARF